MTTTTGASTPHAGLGLRDDLHGALLWERTVVSQEWLAEKLRMKSAVNVSQQRMRLDRKQALDKVPEVMRHFLKKANNCPP